MKKIRFLQWIATITAVASMVTAQPIYAAVNQAPRTATIIDISLLEGGLLEGKLLSTQGQPIQESAVTILQNGLEVARTKTSEEGVFQVAGLRGGVHQIVGKTGTTTCRFWEPGTSPPAANQAAIIVSTDTLVRGQQCDPGCVPRCATACQPACQPSDIATQCITATQCNPGAPYNSGVRRVQYQQPQQPIPSTVEGPPVAGSYVPAGPVQTWNSCPSVSVRHLLIAAGIAAAIAIPIAIAQSKDAS